MYYGRLLLAEDIAILHGWREIQYSRTLGTYCRGHDSEPLVRHETSWFSRDFRPHRIELSCKDGFHGCPKSDQLLLQRYSAESWSHQDEHEVSVLRHQAFVEPSWWHCMLSYGHLCQILGDLGCNRAGPCNLGIEGGVPWCCKWGSVMLGRGSLLCEMKYLLINFLVESWERGLELRSDPLPYNDRITIEAKSDHKDGFKK